VKNLTTISLDQLQEIGFDVATQSAEEEYFDGVQLVEEHMQAVMHHTSIQKENTVTDTTTTYDSGLADPEAPLADHIELAGGVEALVTQVVAAQKEAASRKSEAFDPDLTGYSSVYPLIEAIGEALGLDYPEASDNFHQLVLPKWFGEANPNYITQLWLDEDGPEWEDKSGKPRTSPSRMLVGVWLAGKTPSVVYLEDADLERVESDFARWDAVSIRTFRSEADVKAHIRQQRPGFRPEDVKRARQQLASARAVLAEIVPDAHAEDPTEF
jgi:hypothetical protein